MPVPLKPCEGSFSEETIQILQRNVDRAQWHVHLCVRCGQKVGARLEKGHWVPETHWPSIPKRAPSPPPVGASRFTSGDSHPARTTAKSLDDLIGG